MSEEYSDYDSLHEDESDPISTLPGASKGKKGSKVPTRKHKSKKKMQEQVLDQSDPDQSPEKISSEVKSEPDSETNSHDIEEHEEVPANVLEESIDWPQQDFQELIKRIEMVLPEKDNLAFSTRVEKINWDEIAFNTYSGEKCKKAWLYIQKKMRKYRLLMELLHDAKELLSNSWPTFFQNKNKRHPDMPKRPMTAYLLYYMKKKDRILLENPGMELPELSKKIGIMFKTLSAAKKEKYTKLAIEERKKYETKLEEFYKNHPEVPRGGAAATSKGTDIGPKKPQTPFTLYYEEQLKMCKAEDDDRSTFREQCKEQWKGMSDKKKLIWINWALESESKYQEELKKFLSSNPNYTPPVLKPVLSKEEKLLKDKLAGKPKKPPQTSYALFSQMMMQSEDIKKIDVKYRIKSIAEQWKNSTEEEKKRFKDHSDYLLETYKRDYSNYLESLPEDKRKQEIENNTGKRKKPNEAAPVNNRPKKKAKKTSATNTQENDVPPKDTENEEPTQQAVKELKPKKKKKTQENDDNEVPNQNSNANDFLRILQAEPPTPPMSGLDLFSMRYNGKGPVDNAWRKLKKDHKKEYQNEVEIIKEAYIKDYEKFLKSLTKEQLTIYSELKRKARPKQVSDDSSSNTGD